MRNNREHGAQCAVFSWAKMQERVEPRLSLLYAIPNGGARDRVVGAQLKAEGVKAGVPDICLPVPVSHTRRHDHCQIYHSLYIELKVGRNQPTPPQRRWLQSLRDYGSYAVVCNGAEQAIATLCHYLQMKNPTSTSHTPND